MTEISSFLKRFKNKKLFFKLRQFFHQATSKTSQGSICDVLLFHKKVNKRVLGSETIFVQVFKLEKKKYFFELKKMRLQHSLKKLYFYFANTLRRVLQLHKYNADCRDRCYFGALPPKLRIDFLRANALDYSGLSEPEGPGGPWPPRFWQIS